MLNDQGFETGSLEEGLSDTLGLSSTQFANIPRVAGFLRGAGAPEGFNWNDAFTRTAGAQREQFGGWSSTDDPGQVAMKVLGNVQDPWARTAELALRGSGGFAESQAEGANLWSQQQKDDSIMGIDPDILRFAALTGGLYGLQGMAGMGGAAAGGGTLMPAAPAVNPANALGAAGVAEAGSFMMPAAPSVNPANAIGAGGVGSFVPPAGGGFPMPPAPPVPTIPGASTGGSIWDSILRGIPGGENISKSLPSGDILSRLLNVGTGLYGIKQANDMRRFASNVMTRNDPFASERGRYAGMLSSLMANPGSIVNSPGYHAGEQAIMRRLAAQGYIGSGNMMKALHNFGGEQFDRETARLAQLAGANATPGAGSNIGYSAMSGADAATIAALNRIAYGAKGGM